MRAISKEKIITVSKQDISVSNDKLVIRYNDKVHSFPFSKISKRLSNASITQRENYIVSPSGYGIHWPDIDEDISINALLKDI